MPWFSILLLRKVDEVIHIARRIRSVALQSAVGGMILSGIGMVVAAVGLLPPLTGAIAQEIIDLAAVLNALRVTIQPKPLAISNISRGRNESRAVSRAVNCLQYGVEDEKSGGGPSCTLPGYVSSTKNRRFVFFGHQGRCCGVLP